LVKEAQGKLLIFLLGAKKNRSARDPNLLIKAATVKTKEMCNLGEKQLGPGKL